MESVAAKTPAVAELQGQGVGRGGGGKSRVKRGVEAGDRRKRGKNGRDGVEGHERLGLVKRRELAQLSKSVLDVWVDLHCRAEAFAAVHYAVADRLCLAKAGAERTLQSTTIDLGPRAGSSSSARSESSSSTKRSFSVLEPALTTSTRTSYAPLPPGRGSPGWLAPLSVAGQTQLRSSGGSSPCSRV